MESIQTPNSDFPFNNLVLTPPINSSGGNHFMKFGLNENPLYIQTPKCKVKQCIRGGSTGKSKSSTSQSEDVVSSKPAIDTAKPTNKRAFIDLVFTNENEEFIQWIENLETHCQRFIFTKREKWFDSNLEESDIENLFTSILKSVRMGKQYVMRAGIPILISNMNIYDENENLMSLDDLKEDTNMVCILEFQGIKCSARGFQVDIEVKQILVLKPANIFDRCILSKKQPTQSLETLESKEPPKESIIEDSMQTSEPSGESVISINTDIDSYANEDKILEDLQIKTDGVDDTDEMNDGERLDIEEPKESKEKIEIDTEIDNTEQKETGLLEIDFNLEEVPVQDSIVLKQRNDVYYEMYKEALKKAKMAKDLALSSYLEAKRIKNVYMLDDLSDDSDMEDFVSEEDDILST